MSGNKIKRTSFTINQNKAQVGETMTWVIATIIIIVVLVVSIYAASLLANTKKTLPYQTEKRKSDLIMEKSLFAYFSADELNKSEIYAGLTQQEFYADFEDKFNEITGIIE